MMTFAPMTVVPALAGFGVAFGPMVWPSAGALFGWLLLTALVGSGLGTLRAATSGYSAAATMAPLPDAGPEREPVAPDHDTGHREAA